MNRGLPLLIVIATACAGTRQPPSRSGASRTPPADAGANFTLTLPARAAHSPAAASSETAAVTPPLSETQPDPEPLASQRQYEYDLVYDRGEVRVRKVEVHLFARPVVTARRVGRYAIELWIGRELIDRVRFDFPVIGAEPVPQGSKRPFDEAPSLLPGALVERRVLVPASPRATRAVLVDRATGERRELPWPPDAPLSPVSPDEPPPSRAAVPQTTSPGDGLPSTPAPESPRPGASASDAGVPSAARPDAGAD